MKNWGRSPRPRAAARYQGEITAKKPALHCQQKRRMEPPAWCTRWRTCNGRGRRRVHGKTPPPKKQFGRDGSCEAPASAMLVAQPMFFTPSSPNDLRISQHYSSVAHHSDPQPPWDPLMSLSQLSMCLFRRHAACTQNCVMHPWLSEGSKRVKQKRRRRNRDPHSGLLIPKSVLFGGPLLQVCGWWDTKYILGMCKFENHKNKFSAKASFWVR